MTEYELYLLLHVVGAVVWVGAAFVMVLLGTRSSLARDSDRMLAFVRDAEWLGLRFYLPSNAVVLASALLVVEEGNWGYDQPWILVGVAGLAASFVFGAVFFGPGWARVRKRADESGDAFAASDRVRMLLLVSWIDLGILLAVVFAMTLKPTVDDPGMIAVTAAIPMAVAAVGYVFFLAEGRKPAREGAPI